MSNVPQNPLNRVQLAVMAVATAMIAATRYYSQPLLLEMSRSLHLSPSVIGLVPTLAQAGIALGLLLFVPLGDMVERRRLSLTLLFALSCALALTAAAVNTAMLLFAALLIGIFASVSQLIIGLAATLALPSRRGQVVGMVTAGLLIGVLSARIVAGLLGGAFGWRAMYLTAALGMAGLTLVMALLLPVSRPGHTIAYPQLVRSLLLLAREQRELREASALGALAFAAMNAFWTTLVFFIARPPYHYGASTAGLFGLAGIAGALGAPIVGRISDRGSPRLADSIALTLGLLAFVLLLAAGRHLAGLIGGIVLLDLATQANLVSNQTRIYSLLPDAANRLNTLYMSSYFVGGATGAAVGSLVWEHFGWAGLCAFGIALFATALIVLARGKSSSSFQSTSTGSYEPDDLQHNASSEILTSDAGVTVPPEVASTPKA
jgi:predicted MFS family arabinose efflux permease